MTAKRSFVIAFMVSAFFCSNVFAAKSGSGKQIPELKVLVAHSNQGYAAGIKDLLERNGIKVIVIPLASLRPTVVQRCDLVIITGLGRNFGKGVNAIEFDKPVLGYGVFGCAYFGKLKLKNGYPYT